jgi:superoxide oxidase
MRRAKMRTSDPPGATAKRQAAVHPAIAFVQAAQMCRRSAKAVRQDCASSPDDLFMRGVAVEAWGVARGKPQARSVQKRKAAARIGQCERQLQVPFRIKPDIGGPAEPLTGVAPTEKNMEWKNSTGQYSTWVIGLHWLMLLLLVAVCACMELRGFAVKGSDLRSTMKSLHFALGLSALALVMIRIVVRLSAGAAPAIRPPLPQWQEKAARLLQGLLYVYMVAAPILGWLTLSAAGEPIVLFGLTVPALVGANKSLSHNFEQLHEALATAGYFLIGLHAAAALAHHYVKRDNALVRILPR